MRGNQGVVRGHLGVHSLNIYTSIVIKCSLLVESDYLLCVYNSNKASLILYRRDTFDTLCFGVFLGPRLMP